MDPERIELFWSKVDKSGDCWVWTGCLFSTGYGSFYDRSRKNNRATHAIAYELCVGKVPEGLQLDHLCRNRACCNPAHLEPVTRRENLLRGNTVTAANAKKTHCKYGHEFTDDNTKRDKHGKRYCRLCNTERMRAWRAGVHRPILLA